MKNLKKVLALVLVIAMVMGFAVSASATEFTDAESIAEQNATAVQVLNALNIIEGFEDGSFKPEASVTRAQVAKMIAVAFNHGDESINDLYQNVVCGLTDIGGNWAEGYIKYCYATGIVSGFPDGTYRPNEAVTGNQLCQIMLNILGYEIDTTNTPWATAVMAKSSAVGLLTNVSTAVGSACPRQEAAQIIYNALTLDILAENTLGVKVPSGETILTKYLGVTKYTGVVIANELADLNGIEGIKEGTTEIQLLDSKDQLTSDTIVFDFATGLDDIGESVLVYGYAENIKGVTTALLVSDTGMNNTYTTGAAVKDATALVKASGLSKVADADYYVNYDPATVTVKASWDVQGVLSGFSYTVTNADKTTTTITTRKAGQTIDKAGYEALLAAYNAGTLQAGVVNNGDQTTVSSNVTIDVANTMSWTEFKAKYLKYNPAETYGDSFDGSVNGDYVKVIDFNGDNKADFVLQVETVMDQVTRATAAGSTIITTVNGNAVVLNDKTASTAAVALNADVNIADGETLSAGDVILYADIDGVYYTTLVTPVIDTVSAINYKANTFTGAEETYTMSGIVNVTNLNESLAKMEKKVTYKLYEDLFGYVRAFVEYGVDDYVLLTEMYTEGTTHNQLIKDTVYTAETVDATGEIANYTVASGANIYYDYGSYTGVVPAVVGTGWTNIAGAVITDDEIALYDSFNRYNYKDDAKVTDLVLNLDVTAGVAKGQKLFNGNAVVNYNGIDTNDAYEVNIVNDTVVYYVYAQQNKNQTYDVTDVKVGTGFDFITKVDKSAVRDAYAVATTTGKTSDGKDYAVAKVLVVEIEKDNFETSVTLAIRNVSTKSVEGLLLDATTDQLIGQSGTVDFYTYVTNGSDTNAAGTLCTVGSLYNPVNNATGTDVRGEYAKAGISFIKIRKADVISGKNYVEYFAAKDGGYATAISVISNLPDQKIFKIVDERGVLSAVSVDFEDVQENDELITVYNGGTLAYVLDVKLSEGNLDNLLAAIKADNVPAATKYEELMARVKALDPTADDYVTTATTLLGDLNDYAGTDAYKALTKEQGDNVDKAIADITDGIALAEAKKAAIAAITEANFTGLDTYVEKTLVSDAVDALKDAINAATTVDAVKAIYDGTAFVANQAQVKALTDAITLEDNKATVIKQIDDSRFANLSDYKDVAAVATAKQNLIDAINAATTQDERQAISTGGNFNTANSYVAALKTAISDASLAAQKEIVEEAAAKKQLDVAAANVKDTDVQTAVATKVDALSDKITGSTAAIDGTYTAPTAQGNAAPATVVITLKAENDTTKTDTVTVTITVSKNA